MALGLINLASINSDADGMRDNLVEDISTLLAKLGDTESAAAFRENWEAILKGDIIIRIIKYSEVLAAEGIRMEALATSL
jgi:hypothetical protein